MHTPASLSITVAEAADDWIEYIENEGRERSTRGAVPAVTSNTSMPASAGRKLSSLTTPVVNTFRDDLLKGKNEQMSRPLARKVLTSLKSLLRDAHRRGNVAQNVALSVKIGVNKRDKRKLTVGVDIPKPDEISGLYPQYGNGAGCGHCWGGRRSSPGCGPRNCAAYAGLDIDSRKVSCTSASAPTATARSGTPKSEG